MKKKILFIINPISGIRKVEKRLLPDSINHYLDPAKFEYSISHTQYRGHATLLAKEAAEKGFDIVVAVGGDGSINEVGKGLVRTKTVLGIVPFGSGNGLAHHLGISLNVKKALSIINRFHVKKMDTAEYAEGQYFFSNVGIGFPAYVAERFGTHVVRGFLSYAIAVLREFFHDRTIKIKINLNGKILEREVIAFNVFNANQYGYGVGLTPQANIEDGILNIAVLNKFNRWRFPYYALLVLLKKQGMIPYFEQFESSSFSVINDNKEAWLLQVDGECHKFTENWNVKVHPKSLNVLVP